MFFNYSKYPALDSLPTKYNIPVTCMLMEDRLGTAMPLEINYTGYESYYGPVVAEPIEHQLDKYSVWAKLISDNNHAVYDVLGIDHFYVFPPLPVHFGSYSRLGNFINLSGNGRLNEYVDERDKALAIVKKRLITKTKATEVEVGTGLAEMISEYQATRGMFKNAVKFLHALVTRKGLVLSRKVYNRAFRAKNTAIRRRAYEEYRARLQMFHDLRGTVDRVPHPGKFVPPAKVPLTAEEKSALMHWEISPGTRLSAAYLTKVWFIDPLHKMISGLIDISKNIKDPKRQIRTGFDNYFVIEFEGYHYEVVDKYRARSYLDLDVRAAFARALGINPVVNFWEALPMSFVVNAFFDISYVLENFTFDYGQIKDTYITRDQKVVVDITQDPIMYREYYGKETGRALGLEPKPGYSYSDVVGRDTICHYNIVSHKISRSQWEFNPWENFNFNTINKFKVMVSEDKAPTGLLASLTVLLLNVRKII